MSVSVANRLSVFVLAACAGAGPPAHHRAHSRIYGQPLSIIGVLVPRQPTIDRLPEQCHLVVLDVAPRARIRQHNPRQLGQAQGLIQLSYR